MHGQRQYQSQIVKQVMQSLKLAQTNSDGIDILNQLRNSLAFNISDSEEFVALIVGAFSHQSIRSVSVKLEGIAAYKGLDLIVENHYQDSDGMYQVLARSALT